MFTRPLGLMGRRFLRRRRRPLDVNPDVLVTSVPRSLIRPGNRSKPFSAQLSSWWRTQGITTLTISLRRPGYTSPKFPEEVPITSSSTGPSLLSSLDALRHPFGFPLKGKKYILDPLPDPRVRVFQPYRDDPFQDHNF